MSERRTYGSPCGVARGLDVVGERWALLVVRELLLGPKRFNDLLAGLPGVSPNVLTQRLRDLVAQGVAQRRELGAPTRVHLYELTEWGRELEPMLLQLGRWGSRAPLPTTGELGVDSLLLGIKAALDPAEAAHLAGTYEIRLGADSYAVEVGTDGTMDIARKAASRPDATLTTDLDTLRALVDGRLSLADADRSGQLSVTGDNEAGEHLIHLLLGPRRATGSPGF